MHKLIKQVLNAKKLVVISILVDISFFVSLGLIVTPISKKIIDLAIQMGKGIKQLRIGEILAQDTTGTSLSYILLFYVIVFLLYVIFHGSAWWIANKIANKKTKYLTYLREFLKVNILWGVILMVIHFIDFLLNMRYRMQNVLTPGITNITEPFFMILSSAVMILAFLSYPALKFSAPFKTPIKKTAPIILALVIIYLITKMPLPFYAEIPYISAIITAIIAFALLVLLRVYAIDTIK